MQRNLPGSPAAPLRFAGTRAVRGPVARHRAKACCARIAAMRAATIRDGTIAVEEHPDPRPQAGELLVRVKAAGINGADMMQLAGRYPAPPGAPEDIPGLELAGEVRRVRPRRQPLRARRPRDGRRRRRRAGRAGRGPRARGDAGARGPRLDRRGRHPGGVHHRPRRALLPGRPAPRRAAARARRRRRRRHGRRPARHDGRRARDRDGARRARARAHRRARASTRSPPRASPRPARSTSSSSSSAGRTCPRTCRRWPCAVGSS